MAKNPRKTRRAKDPPHRQDEGGDVSSGARADGTDGSGVEAGVTDGEVSARSPSEPAVSSDVTSGSIASPDSETESGSSPSSPVLPVSEAPAEAPDPTTARVLGAALRGTTGPDEGKIARGKDEILHALGNGDHLGPLRNAILFATPLEWRAHVASVVDAIIAADPRAARDRLLTLSSWGAAIWSSGYDQGHLDAQRGRYFQRGAADTN